MRGRVRLKSGCFSAGDECGRGCGAAATETLPWRLTRTPRPASAAYWFCVRPAGAGAGMGTVAGAYCGTGRCAGVGSRDRAGAADPIETLPWRLT
jgi:hypothetical protein